MLEYIIGAGVLVFLLAMLGILLMGFGVFLIRELFTWG